MRQSTVMPVPRPVSHVSWPLEHVFGFDEATEYMNYLERTLAETKADAEQRCADIEKKYFAEKHRASELEEELAKLSRGCTFPNCDHVAPSDCPEDRSNKIGVEHHYHVQGATTDPAKLRELMSKHFSVWHTGGLAKGGPR